MCRPARCRACGNTTWSGCGQHVDQVMAGVPRDQRCSCNGRGAKAGSADTGDRGSLWSRLTGR